MNNTYLKLNGNITYKAIHAFAIWKASSGFCRWAIIGVFRQFTFSAREQTLSVSFSFAEKQKGSNLDMVKGFLFVYSFMTR